MRSRKFSLLPLIGLVLWAPSVGLQAQATSAAGADGAAAKAPGFEVVLPVAAHDKKGVAIKNLQAAELTLTDEGKPQTIKSLSRDPDLPFRIGLLVETTRTVAPAMESERKAADVLVDKLLGADAANGKNEIFLLHFDRQVELLQDFTRSRDRLHRELEAMGPSPARSSSRSQGPERMGDEREGMPRGNASKLGNPSQIYDALYLAANELMQSKDGRKALVLFSDGVDSGSKLSLNDAVDAADRAGVAIYTIYFKGEQERSFTSNFPGMGGGSRGGSGGSNGGGFPGSGGGGYPGSQRPGSEQKSSVDGKKILEKIAQRTGGRAYEAKKKENLEEIHTQILEELRNLYWLSFTPNPVDKEGGFHKVVLKSSKSEYELTTPEGYYAAKP